MRRVGFTDRRFVVAAGAAGRRRPVARLRKGVGQADVRARQRRGRSVEDLDEFGGSHGCWECSSTQDAKRARDQIYLMLEVSDDSRSRRRMLSSSDHAEVSNPVTFSYKVSWYHDHRCCRVLYVTSGSITTTPTSAGLELRKRWIESHACGCAADNGSSTLARSLTVLGPNLDIKQAVDVLREAAWQHTHASETVNVRHRRMPSACSEPTSTLLTQNHQSSSSEDALHVPVVKSPNQQSHRHRA
nr:hypothetical protein CFP56_72404 [Quercus suber]